MTNYDETEGLPRSLKIAMTTINRMGFPIVAFGMMWYLCNSTIEHNTRALAVLTRSMDVHNRMADEAIKRILGEKRYRELISTQVEGNGE